MSFIPSAILQIYIPSTEVAPSIIYEYYTLEENVGPWGRVGQRGHVASADTFSWVYRHFRRCTDACASGEEGTFTCGIKIIISENFLKDSVCVMTTWCLIQFVLCERLSIIISVPNCHISDNQRTKPGIMYIMHICNYMRVFDLDIIIM